jgi:hypothetical protein
MNKLILFLKVNWKTVFWSLIALFFVYYTYVRFEQGRFWTMTLDIFLVIIYTYFAVKDYKKLPS